MNVASLNLNVTSSSVNLAGDRLDRLAQSAGKAERATSVLSGSWGKLMGAVGLAAGAIASAKQFSDVVVEYEGLEAQLKTATGSAENAAVAFDRLKVFATETPYALNQSVDAFIKLVNLGLTPSERAMRSYGDTASAMGKDLTTMVQAVSNATVGEFEMLKQFGIKAQSDGDKIRFIFRGTTTEVANTASSIEQYMIRLGETNFAGAMTEKMATLGGAFSNLEDSWDQLVYAMAKSGPAEGVKALLSDITAAMNDLTKAFESGQAQKNIEAFFNKFSTGGAAAKAGFAVIHGELTKLDASMAASGNVWLEALSGTFTQFPENVAAAMGAVGASLGLLDVYVRNVCSYTWTLFSGTWDMVVSYVKGALNALATGSVTEYVKSSKAAFDTFLNTVSAGADAVANEVTAANGAWAEQVDTILAARKASIDRTAALQAEAVALRQKADAETAGKDKGKDGLAPFKVEATGASPQFVALQKSLRGEVEEIRMSYAERRQIIAAEDQATLEQKTQMLAQLASMEAADNQKRLEGLVGNQQMELAQMQTGDEAALMVENMRYQRELADLQSFLAQKKLTQDEYDKAREMAAQIHAKKVENTERASVQARLQQQQMLLSAFSNVASGLESLAKEGSAAQKAAFLASKAIAIAQAIVNTEMAATSAMAQGGHPIMGMSLATMIRIAGYASVGVIAAQTVMGMHEHGGMIPAGKSGLVGETGMPEVVRGPAMVTSARTTADMLRGSVSSGGTSVSVNVINNSGASVDVEESGEGNEKTINVIISRVKRELASEIRTGGSEIASTIESTYRMRRGGSFGSAA